MKPFKADYDQISEKWNKQRQGLPFKDQKQFDLFVELLPEKSTILDLGCGTGAVITNKLVKAGHEITGVDRSEKLLSLAKKLLPKTTFIKAEIEDYKIESNFEGTVLWDVLFHIPRKHHEPLLRKIYKSLKHDGHLILTSGGFDEDIPAFTDQMFGAEFFYDSLTPIKLIALVKKIGFRVHDFSMLNTPDENGERDKGRLGLVLRKP